MSDYEKEALASLERAETAPGEVLREWQFVRAQVYATLAVADALNYMNKHGVYAKQAET